MRGYGDKYPQVVQQLPVAIWQEDWSAIDLQLDRLREDGIGDLRQHLCSNPRKAMELREGIRLLECNPAAHELFAAETADDIVAALHRCIETGSAVQEFAEALAAYAAGQRLFETQLALQTRAGESICVLIRIALPTGEASTKLALVTAIDISRRQQAEDELRARAHGIGYLLRALEATVDHTRDIGEVCRDIVSELPRALADPRRRVARVQIDGHESSSTHWREPVSALRKRILADGKDVGYIEIGYLGRDGSMPPQTQLSHDDALISVVAVHLGQTLTRRQLATFMTQTEKLKVVGELAGGIAHDFNNLLTTMVGNASYLAECLYTDAELGPLAEMVSTAAQRGADLTSRLLAFARRQPLDPQPIDVNQLLMRMQSLLQPVIGERIEVIVRADDDSSSIALVDGPQLESALLNLCINARDAMRLGGQLTLETANVRLDRKYTAGRNEVTPGAYVMLVVSDTGGGMSEDVLNRALDPFFTTKPAGGGSGLGLSMVYGFVKQSRGHMEISSVKGHGTVVRLYFPRAFDADASTSVGAGPAARGPHGNGAG